jgi:hypothetical protein
MSDGRGAHSRIAWPPTKADLLAVVLTGSLIAALVGEAWWPAVVLAVLLTATVLSPRAVQTRAEGPGIVVQASFDLDDEISPAAPGDRSSPSRPQDPSTCHPRSLPRKTTCCGLTATTRSPSRMWSSSLLRSAA